MATSGRRHVKSMSVMVTFAFGVCAACTGGAGMSPASSSPASSPSRSDGPGGQDAARRSAPGPAITAAAANALPATRIVARVDGVDLPAADAYRLVRLAAPNEAANAIQQLVVDRLSASEAETAGVTVPAEVLDREVEREFSDQERRIKEQTKGERDLAGYVRGTWDLSSEEYREVVRGTLARQLLLERVVLGELGLHPRVQIRVIRVKQRTLAEEIREKLAKGADFAALARQHSEDGSAREGGVYPPLPSDLPSPLFERTEGLDPGEVSGIDEISTSEGPRYRIVQVLARLPAEPKAYSERAAAIERVLEGRRLSPLELEAWTRIMEDRHEVRIFGLNGTGSDDGESQDGRN